MPPLQKVVIRSWPKMVFAWPLTVAAIGAGLVCEFEPTYASTACTVFLCVLAFNVMMLSFEFTAGASLFVALGAVAAATSFLLANRYYAMIVPLRDWMLNREFSASAEFFLAIGAILIFAMVGMYMRSRFDFWELSANELVHRRGVLGNTERFSTVGLKVSREIPDVFEYFVCGAGRIIMTIPGGQRTVVLENVIGIKRIEKQADVLLSAQVVKLSAEDVPRSQAG